MTTVTKLKGEVRGNFPVLTNHGIIEYPELGRYINALEKEGYIVSDLEIDALKEFFKSGYENNWINKILYALPFIGDSGHIKAAAVPMIDRFHNNETLRIGAGLHGLDYNNNYTPYFKVNASTSKVIASIPYRNDMCLVAPLSVYDLFTKVEDCEFKNKGLYGVCLYGKSAKPESTQRFFGANGGERENWCGMVSTFNAMTFGNSIANSAILNGFSDSALHYYNSYNHNANGIYRYSFGDSTFNITLDNQTDVRTIPTTIQENEKETRFGINAAWNNHTITVSHGSLNLNQELRFIMWHDGTLRQYEETTFIPALKKLLTSLGKA